MSEDWDNNNHSNEEVDQIDQHNKPEQYRAEDSIEDDIEDLGLNFDFDGFQVVRREFFAHMNEPSITFCDYKFYVNAACLRKFPDTDFIQVLVNPNTRIIALRPCSEFARDALPWSKETKGKKTPRQTTCKLLLAKLVSLLGWNPINRYKLLGKRIRANGETLVGFDLNSVEVYLRTPNEKGKLKSSRVASFPADWKDQFGMSFTEHRQSLQINTFEGYAIFSVKDEKKYEDQLKPQMAQ